MIIENLITDRTLADVTAVKNLAEAIKAGTATANQVQQYLNVHQKGAYAHEDLNRVMDAISYIANRLVEAKYLSAPLPLRYWSVTDKPNTEDFNRYFENVAIIRKAIATWRTTPEAPTGVIGFDVNKANALEQILIDVDQILNHMRDSWHFLGDLYAAEV